MKTINLKIQGMHCKSCEVLITDALSDIGVTTNSIDSKSGNATLEFDERTITLAKIKAIIAKEGYHVL